MTISRFIIGIAAIVFAVAFLGAVGMFPITNLPAWGLFGLFLFAVGHAAP